MLEIRTVLCPVDFSPLGEREVDLAVGVCRQFGARLVLHHNLDAVSVGLSMGWMWNQVHAGEKPTEAMVEARLKELLASLPEEVSAEARLSDGPVPAALHYLQEQVAADLVILGTHGASSEDHTSVAERIVADARCPVVVLHDGENGATSWPADRPERCPVLVPIDWSDGAMAALRLACELARRLPLELHLLHVTPSRGAAVPAAADQAAEKIRLAGAVPDDLRERCVVHLAAGDPDDEIVAASARVGAFWIVMGAHGKGLLRRFTHDTAKALLHRASCPVWFVPATWKVA